MGNYYSDTLSAERLRMCYEVAPPRAKQYLEAEIEFVLDRVHPLSCVLELGCGYGRVLHRLACKAGIVIGIDTSHASLVMADDMMKDADNCFLAGMDATRLAFSDKVFDLVLCIQNGISAFKVDQKELIREAVRVMRPGGRALFSSYSDRFWDDRLEWFEIQARHGLIGEIDNDRTGHGVIVGKDGFRATTVGPEEFRALTVIPGITTSIYEVDHSSIFCEIRIDQNRLHCKHGEV